MVGLACMVVLLFLLWSVACMVIVLCFPLVGGLYGYFALFWFGRWLV